jgi:hypothetical protein
LTAYVQNTLTDYEEGQKNKTNENKDNKRPKNDRKGERERKFKLKQKVLLTSNSVIYVCSMNFIHIIPIINKWGNILYNAFCVDISTYIKCNLPQTENNVQFC